MCGLLIRIRILILLIILFSIAFAAGIAPLRIRVIVVLRQVDADFVGKLGFHFADLFFRLLIVAFVVAGHVSHLL